MTVVSLIPPYQAAALPTEFIARIKYALSHVGWQDLGAGTPNGITEMDIYYASGEYHLWYTIGTSVEYKHAAAYADLPAAAVHTPTGSVGYYPSAQKVGSTIHLIGTGTINLTDYNNSADGGATFTNPGPLSRGKVGQTFVAIPIDDAQMRQNPADNYWYVVGLFHQTTPLPPDLPAIYKIAATVPEAGHTGVYWHVASGGTDTAPADLFDGHRPSWGSLHTPDPNLIFYDNRLFLTFNGTTTDEGTPEHTEGILELSTTTFKAIADATVLYNANDLPGVASISDVNLVTGPDAIDRLFGYGGGHLFVLELP